MGTIQPFFLEPGPGRGQRFCIFHPALGEPRGQVLHLHAFAEEMNKSRRMTALQARALAAAGFAVLQIDLLGCGDSSGDFGDASWQDWIDDALAAVGWLRRQAGAATPLWLWGQRAGCLLACELAPRFDERCNFLFWQPPVAGKPLLLQFLRLKLAAGLLNGQSTGAMEALKKQLAGGETIEIAGYRLSAELAYGLERATLRPPTQAARATWFEMTSRSDGEVSPALESAAQRWAAADIALVAQAIRGPSFWQTSEIEDAPALISATTAALLTPATEQPPAEVDAA